MASFRRRNNFKELEKFRLFVGCIITAIILVICTNIQGFHAFETPKIKQSGHNAKCKVAVTKMIECKLLSDDST